MFAFIAINRPLSQVSRICRTLLGLLLFVFLLSGCSTYGESVKTVVDDTRQQNYLAADRVAKDSLSPIGADRLLYYLERGMIAHLDKRYQDSNKLLEQAYDIADSLYRTDIKDVLASAMTHPGNATYKGQLYERVFLHYTKMLNYLMLAQESASRKKLEQWLDGARVENRRLQLLLDEHVFKVGDYREAKNEKEELFQQFTKVFRQLTGASFDPNKLLFRDQAFAHYVMGAMYELYGELDNARISYQRAARLYEEGYIEQYHLDPEMAKQAWQDTVRIMQKAGGYQDRWPQLIKEKGLKKTPIYQPEMADLLVLQHVDLSPERKVLNMHLTINKKSKQLVLRPIPLGSRQERKEQAAWFYLLHADKGIYNLIRDFYDGSIFNSEGLFFNSQATTLAPIWSIIEKTGLDQTLGDPGIRVAIPYYPVPYEPVRKSEINIDTSLSPQSASPLIKADSVAMLGLLQQVMASQGELYSAMARETLRNMAVQEALKDLGKWAKLGSKLLTASTTGTDTRSWLLLPHSIRLQRLQLPAGNHNIKLTSYLANGKKVEQNHQVELAAGHLKILNLRTFVPVNKKLQK